MRKSGLIFGLYRKRSKVGGAAFWVRWGCCLAQLLALLCGASNAVARPVDHITERSWLEDPSGSKALHELRQSDFASFEGVLAKGYGPGVIWIRLHVDPSLSSAHMDEQLVLRVRPGYLDDVTLFDEASGLELRSRSGDRVPINPGELRALSFLLPLVRSEEARVVWVRVKTTSTRQIALEVLRESDAIHADIAGGLWSSMYLALLVLLVVWGLGLLVSHFDRLTLAFVAFQTCSFAYGLFSLGHVRVLLGDQLPAPLLDEVTSALVLLATWAGVVFNGLLLVEMSMPRWGRLFYLLLGLVALVQSAAFICGEVSQALVLNMYGLLAIPFVCVVLAWKCSAGAGALSLSDSPFARRLGQGYFMLSAALTTAAALPGLGLFVGSSVTLYIVMLHGVFSGLFMAVMLQYRLNLKLQQRDLLAMEVQYNRRWAMQEHSFRTDREKLLAMLGHELRTPLATLRMLLGVVQFPLAAQRDADSAIRDMNNVIERSQQTGQLEDGALQVRNELLELSEVIEHLCLASAAPSRIRVEMACDAAATRIRSDRQLVETIVRNLLENAIKYSPEQSLIQVLLSASERKVSFKVANLVGKAGRPDASMVFTKYYRNPAASRWTGSGLGLYLIDGIAKSLGASVRFISGEDHVAFVVTFQSAA